MTPETKLRFVLFIMRNLWFFALVLFFGGLAIGLEYAEDAYATGVVASLIGGPIIYFAAYFFSKMILRDRMKPDHVKTVPVQSD